MNNINILWTDDEIELLKPHIIFLEEKGYSVTTANSGDKALDLLAENHFDIVFLDENMPGLSGLQTLEKLKSKLPSLPVIMITKSEEEFIMDEAIGSKISDYLIKPVNPNQILLSIKKNLDTTRLVNEKNTSAYQQEFRSIGMRLNERLDHEDWIEVYEKLIYWELEMENSEGGMMEVLQMQKAEANRMFSRFMQENYEDWLHTPEEAPLMSHNLFKHKVAPLINTTESTFFVVIDNLRLDQWKIIKPLVNELFWTEEESVYYSILPTTTHYCRNAIFAGLMPSEIEKKYPNMWLNDEDKGGKNMHEKDFIGLQLKRLGKDVKFSYNKVLNLDYGKKLADQIPNLFSNPINVIVYNFVDMLSHARTDTEIIRELAEDESAYRSLTLSWFEHSPLYEALKQIAAKKGKVVISTDHGSIRVKEPVKIVGSKDTNTNLRYKQGKNLTYNPKEVFEVRNPEHIYLPKVNVSQLFVFANEDHFFAYPNNYNHYVKHYRDTFQHGGVSLEEVLIPVVTLSAK
jgi:DNA-binding response OmpR family regulator